MTANEPLAAFDTVLGRCAVGWNAAGITGVELPGPATRRIPTIDGCGDVPDFVRAAVAGMTAVLAGKPADLRHVPLDERRLEVFRRRVYAATREIPAGTTTTYGQIARAIGQPDGARDVGVALSRNPFPIVVPCHRVVAANGTLTGFSAPGGLATKRRMLQLEGAPGYGQLGLFDGTS